MPPMEMFSNPALYIGALVGTILFVCSVKFMSLRTMGLLALAFLLVAVALIKAGF